MIAFGPRSCRLSWPYLRGRSDLSEAIDYLGALRAACSAYEEKLGCAFARRHLPGTTGLDAAVELVRYARGCVEAFEADGFDGLFDFERDFVWRHGRR